MARMEAVAQTQQVTPVCAIGASAGGVQALREFFRHVPDDLGVAYVVIIHLAPDHPSSLSEILGGVTRMQVQQVAGGTRLTPNCVYVIPPDRELVIEGDDVQARSFTEPRGQRAPIDMFFRSIALGRGDGIAVVLSGAGSDGAMGVRAVKEAGGVIFVQEPVDAEFPMMPRSALATGAADFVGPIPRLVERIVEVSRSKEALRRLDVDGAEGDLRRIMDFLRARTGHDFTSYKRGTVMRRVARRMQVTRRPDMAAYAEYLVTNPEEAQELFDDLLISVTQFFRDPEAYGVLAEQAVAPMIDAAVSEPDVKSIRAWVVGCATGEEAYSLAILLLEEAERRRVAVPIQIFASDLDEGALATGREGRYPASIEADVSEERLKRWFVREGPHYRVRGEVRDCVLFASHSVLKDVPFMRMDLVSCRNLLIYLERDLQQQVCTLFHYGLNPHGFLFLGSAETIDAMPEFFFPVHRQARLYRARPVARRSLPILDYLPPGHRPDMFKQRPTRRRRDDRHEPEVEHGTGAGHAAAVEQSAPPSALVDAEHRVLHLSPSASRFMLPGGGPFSADITALVRPELRLDLGGALRRALEHGETTLTLPLPVQFNGSRRRVLLQVSPVRTGDGSPSYRALVFFLDGGEVGGAAAVPEGGDEEVRRVREELRAVEERLAASRQEHEGAIQDLRITNEELQSINEEYRSTSEELETSKEELQSMNEELHTVNAELKSKLESISSAHSDLQNLVTSTEMGALFLDSDLRLKLFTPAVVQHFNIADSDIGRPISDFTHRLVHDGFDQDARGVLRSLEPFVREVATVDGRWLVMRMRPYRTIDDRIDGIVVTLFDITLRREAEARLRESEARYRTLFETMGEGLLFVEVIRDEAGRAVDVRYIEANPAAVQLVRRDFMCRRLREVSPELEPHWWEIPGRVAKTGQSERHEALAAAPLGQWFDALFWKARPDDDHVAILFRDVTERQQHQEERELLARELSHRVKNTLAVVGALARRTGGRTVGEFRETFSGRLDALAQAHGLLLADDWRSADLNELVRQSMAPYDVEDGGRIRIEGEPAQLSAQQALSLSLVLHELGTNALKYGALSVVQGRVRIAWRMAGEDGSRMLHFRWAERDGPPVTPPKEDGFGSQLIVRAAEFDLAGSAELQWAPEGLTFELRFPPG